MKKKDKNKMQENKKRKQEKSKKTKKRKRVKTRTHKRRKKNKKTKKTRKQQDTEKRQGKTRKQITRRKPNVVSLLFERLLSVRPKTNTHDGCLSLRRRPIAAFISAIFPAPSKAKWRGRECKIRPYRILKTYGGVALC